MTEANFFDPLFRVELIAATPNPQQCIYAAMHQDYSEEFVYDEKDEWPDETRAGEIAVKRLFAGERGHYGCYSDDTEVLTLNGWKFWPEVTWKCLLAAINIETQQIKFEYPVNLQKIPLIDGDGLYHVKTQKIDMKVTLDHRMVVSTRGTNGFSPWRFATAQSIIGKAVRYMTGGELSDSERLLPSDIPPGVDLASLFRLAGFFYGDGLRSNNSSPRCVRFRLRRFRKILYLHGLGFKVEAKAGERFVIHDQAIAAWIHKHFTSENGKKLPDWIIRLPSALLHGLLDGLRNSDGTLRGRGWALDSVEKESLDLLQAACLVNSIPATLSLNNPNSGIGHENHKPCWRLHFGSGKCTARQESNQVGRTKGEEKIVPYSGYVYCATVSTGALIVRRNNRPVVSGNCTEHSQIILNVGWFPHSVMQQARTHRIGCSFDVQSMRYTGQRISDILDERKTVEEVFYLRPVGFYSDRNGKKYEYTKYQRDLDLDACYAAAGRYSFLVNRLGYAEEHARGLLPFDYRQHFVVSFSMRAFMHFLDLRAKKDAQVEIRALCDLMLPHFRAWAPEICSWYEKSRLGKARLAP